MTNYELWRLYTARLHSPKQFLDAAFYYTIGAALERRVWVGSGHAAIYPNQYVLLCAKAGVGKGLATGAAKALLDSVAATDDKTKPFLQKGPDSGSYEALVHRLADSVRNAPWVDDQGNTRPYAYSCLRLELDELLSFFHKDADNAVKFFCTIWSGTGYDRDTLGRGLKPLGHPLMSFLAGATPDDMRKLQRCDVMGSGFDRRIMIVYAAKNEYEQFLIREPSEEELNAGTKLSDHVAKLCAIRGRVRFSDEAVAYAQALWKSSKRDVNTNPILQSYNDNKQPHWQKIAMAMHFAEGEPAERLKERISVETIQRAIAQLNSYEMLRHHAYDRTADNELMVVARKLMELMVERRTMNQDEILKILFPVANLKQIDEVLEYLKLSGRISQDGETFKVI